MILQKYRISANSFRRNYSFLNLTLCTVTFTVADYRWITVRLQLKTLLPCILLLTSAIKVQLRQFTIEITGKSLATVQKTVISIVDYLYFWGQIL